MSLESDSSPCVCIDNASQIKQKQKIMHKSSGPRLGHVTHSYTCINAIGLNPLKKKIDFVFIDRTNRTIIS